MAHPIRVRPATWEDWPTLADFNVALARETERRDLPREVVASGVRGLLARPEAGFYRVAQMGTAIAGCLMVTFEWSDWRDGFFWWIQSVYVRPGFRRQGVFRSLLQHLQAEARGRDDVRGIRLYVEHDNAVAQRTYAALGFRPARYRIYECGV